MGKKTAKAAPEPEDRKPCCGCCGCECHKAQPTYWPYYPPVYIHNPFWIVNPPPPTFNWTVTCGQTFGTTSNG